ncbi:MAG: binding-protein-dependent transport system inner membrane protein [Candidatus Roseilinea sp.]|nr:MAG: binding-protein-dependent transport system inner membrane protein [Candidatus Roseilinea sp.]
MESRTRTRAYYAILWLIAILFFLPIFWILLAAFKTDSDILAVPPKLIFTPTLEQINRALFGRGQGVSNTIPYLVNSLLLSILSVTLAIIVSFLAAYAFSRYKLKTTNFLMFLMLSTRMVPASATIIAIFQMYNAFDIGLRSAGLAREPLFRGFPGVLLLYTMFSIPFSLWILKGFIDGVSPRYDETAYVNGASRWHVLFRVVLPQVKPGIVAAFIFNLIFVWNEFLFNFILGTPTTNTQMIPYALAVGLISPGGNVDWGYIASLSMLYVLLPMVMIFFFQKYLLVGMTFGTVRGEV